MPPCTFLLDFFVPLLRTSEDIADPQRLTVDIKFNRNPVRLTASRINVNDFKDGDSTEIVVDPSQLRGNLEANGIDFAVRYGGRIVGAGKMELPQTLIDRIDPNMPDLVYSDSCKLMVGAIIKGHLTLTFRLVVKCFEQINNDENQPCANLAENLNAHDIFFVMAQSNPCRTPCEPCADVLEPAEGDERLALDLSRYRSTNRRIGNPPEIAENMFANTATCALKKLATEYENIIESVTNKFEKHSPIESPCYRHGRGQFIIPGSCQVCSQVEEKVSRSEPNMSCSGNRRNRKNAAEDSRIVSQKLYVPIPGTDDESIKPIRFCPICLTNMSWLPKFAECPRCGLKPTPKLEKHLEEHITADDVLKEFIGQPQDAKDDHCADPCEVLRKEKLEEANEEANKTCRCTCRNHKTCAHCRIRKVCCDILQSVKVKKPECPKEVPRTSEDFCIIAKSSDNCRPYLKRVFSELRNLYEIKEKSLKSKTKLDCNTFEWEKKKKTANKKISPKNETTVETPIFERKKRCKKVGHKHCVKRNTGVSCRHGWDWMSGREARKHGWKPGAVLRPIDRIMKFFLKYPPTENAFEMCKKREKGLKEQERQLPVLNITKQNGKIFITLRPLGSSELNQKPITFKIQKSELAITLREIKRSLKDKGFAKCTCHRSLMLCVCRNYMEKKELEFELNKECARRLMPSCVDRLVLTDTSDSEMEYTVDVTPPAGVIRPPPPLKPHCATQSTQTRKADRQVKPLYPIKLSPYYRAYDCGMEGRFRGTAFGDLVEQPFEDSVFGYRGGGLHGKPPPRVHRLQLKSVWGKSPGAPISGPDPKGFGLDAWKGLSAKLLRKIKENKKKISGDPMIPANPRKKKNSKTNSKQKTNQK